MKISCQSCHSKYNVADEKVQGKIVKIRCRKCGATIVVNASGGALANGSVPAPAPAAPQGASAGRESEGEWHVSVADNDQRTMSLAELVDAYNAGVVAQDTFVWTEGMGDWKPLSEVDVVVSALHAAVQQAPAPVAPAPAPAFGYGLSAPAAASPVYEAAPRAPAVAYPEAAPAYEGGFASQAAASPEPRRAAVVKREARARDLFATRTGEEMHTSAPVTHSTAPPLAGDDSKLTGQRNENSVLFSLDHLTKNSEPQRPQDTGFARSKDDSGLIDLKALSAKAESMRPPTLHDANALSAPLAPPLGFAAPLGAPLGGFGPGSEDRPKSKLPLLIGGGAGVALLLVLGIVIGLKIGGGATPAPAATANAAPGPSASATAEASASAASAAPLASASAAPSASASAPPAPVAMKPRPFGGGGGGSAFKQAVSPKPAGAAGAVGGGTGAGGGGAGAGAGGGGSAAGGAATGAGGAAPAPAKKGDCGCNGDLMCMMKCSTH